MVLCQQRGNAHPNVARSGHGNLDFFIRFHILGFYTCFTTESISYFLIEVVLTLSSKYIFSVRMEYVGGLARDCKTPCYTNTDAQKAALRKLLDNLHKCYSRTLIAGISDLDPKKPCCPGFDANKEYRDLEPVV